jgi:hypothetical protein
VFSDRRGGFNSLAFRLSSFAPMVKRTSSLASNEAFRVRVLVGALIVTGARSSAGVDRERYPGGVTENIGLS